jgi:hypothetical protein
LSIKGAASKLIAKEMPQQVQVPTLMDRMQVDEPLRDGQSSIKKKRRNKPIS